MMAGSRPRHSPRPVGTPGDRSSNTAVRRVRVDKLLVDRGLVSSRERARRLVMAGDVWIAQQRIDKPGTLVAVEAPLDVRGSDIPFVSRGGLKLAAALEHWHIDPTGLVAIDVGASTGGFTDCLLQRGARRVVAIDVGYGQFAWRLRRDPRVHLHERTNIRTFDPRMLVEPADIAVVDVSFISLRLVLGVVQRLVRPGGVVLALVKPQFEVGKGQVGKGGVVRDHTQRQQATQSIREFGEQLGLTTRGEFASPVPGPKGNREIFLRFAVTKRPSSDA
jgi:23S rRNA (cytidine1920-2'-O)/16S rRNA (cytidine1409-2'-O)-methyltransferase